MSLATKVRGTYFHIAQCVEPPDIWLSEYLEFRPTSRPKLRARVQIECYLCVQITFLSYKKKAEQLASTCTGVSQRDMQYQETIRLERN